MVCPCDDGVRTTAPLDDRGDVPVWRLITLVTAPLVASASASRTRTRIVAAPALSILVCIAALPTIALFHLEGVLLLLGGRTSRRSAVDRERRC